MKRISLLGSTGSIGVNSLNVIGSHPEKFRAVYLTAHSNVERLYEQAKAFRPQAVAIAGAKPSRAIEKQFKAMGVEVYFGRDGLLEIAGREDVDLVVSALVGAAGLEPARRAIEAGKNLALANKEPLVMAGEIVVAEAKQRGVAIIPIDSEHSAILQCLLGEDPHHIAKVFLTASGGPFREISANRFSQVTVAEALRHPNWSMGRKITIDSATLMNKGLEVIEAHWLFGLALSQIQVVIHPQSIIHSMVEFIDGSVKAQLGVPDMRIPIQFALTYPERTAANFPRLDFSKPLRLDFYPPDLEKFRALQLAYQAAEMGGTAPAVLNAANEVAVRLFLQERIGFDRLAAIVEDALSVREIRRRPSLEDILEADRQTRRFVEEKYGVIEPQPELTDVEME